MLGAGRAVAVTVAMLLLWTAKGSLYEGQAVGIAALVVAAGYLLDVLMDRGAVEYMRQARELDRARKQAASCCRAREKATSSAPEPVGVGPGRGGDVP